MTFMIILGAFAGLYILILLFRLASIALPLFAGIGAGLWMLDRGFGYLPSIAGGLVLGIFILWAGRVLCAVLPPFHRGLVALAFAIPAGFAGYQAAKGIAGLALADGAVLELLGIAGTLTAAVAAWQSLGSSKGSTPEAGPAVLHPGS